jgi:branched-chain amino acid transport system substrate-binding protein
VKHLLILALLLCQLGPVAACTSRGGAGPTVKIGLVAPFEGLYRPLGYEVLPAVKLAIKERNQAGGAGGRIIELVALNDGQDPATAAQRAREMVVDPDIMGVIGHFDDETTLAALPVYAKAGLALVVSGARAVEVTGGGYSQVFRLGADNGTLGAVMARYAVLEEGVTQFALVHGQEDLAASFSAEAEKLGAEIVLDLESEQDELAPMLANASPDAVFFSGEALEAGDLLLQMREAGLNSPLLGGSGLDSAYLVQIAGDAAEGTTYASVVPPVEDPAFVDAYRLLSGIAPGPRAALAYDATRILLDALQEAIATDGRPTRQGVVAALSRGKRYQGLTGEIWFDEQGQASNDEVYIYTIVDERYPGQLQGVR